MQHSKKIQSLEVEDVKAIEAQLPLHGQHPMALQLLDALHEVAVLTLNDDNEVSYANPFARLIFNLDAPKVKARKHKPTKSNLYYLLEKLQEQPSEFTLQYAVDSQVRTLKAYAIDLINQKTHQQLVYMFDTTSLVLSDLKLRETEALLQVLIDTSPDYICIKDGNNRWLKANQKLLSLFQINPESYAHQTNVDLATTIHPVFNNAFQYSEKSDETTWRTQKAYRNEEIIYLPQGTEKTLDVSKIATFNSDASRQHLVIYAQDISEQKFIEKQLQNRSAILDALISCDWLLHSSDSWHAVAKTVLQQSCLALRFTRAAILKNLKQADENGTYSKVLYQWATTGFTVPINNFEAINFDDTRLSRWKDILQKGSPVFSEIADLPAEERLLLKQHDATCIAIVPLFVENAWWGNIVIERCYDTDKTSSQELGS
ncbi:MAG: bifunctional diguanylate cyclase/phosphodiesterase, partial [Methylophilales bacterium 28-44-11]